MRPDRLAVFSTVCLLVLVTLATGPQLGLLSVPEGGLGGADDPGTGSADLEVVSAPERATLEADEFGDVHHLTVPETTVAVSNVTGAPLLTLSVDLPDLGYRRSSVFAIPSRQGPTQSYAVERAALESDRLDRDAYEGILRIVLRDDAGRTVVYEEPITVEVVG